MNISCYVVIVVGGKQSGKTTFIHNSLDSISSQKRRACAVNLDPSTKESFNFPITDIRGMYTFQIFLDHYGPKKALPACMDLILQDVEWFHNNIFNKNVKYMFIEIPSEFEIILQVGVLPKLINIFRSVNCNVCIAYLLESQFVTNPFQFIGGYLYAMSNISMFGVPHINFLTKCDLLSENQIQSLNRLCQNNDNDVFGYICSVNPRIQQMTSKIFALLHNFSFERFIQFDISDEMNIMQCIKALDEKLNYIPSEHKEEEEEEEDFNDDNDINDLVWPQNFKE